MRSSACKADECRRIKAAQALQAVCQKGLAPAREQVQALGPRMLRLAHQEWQQAEGMPLLLPCLAVQPCTGACPAIVTANLQHVCLHALLVPVLACLGHA